MGKLTGMTGFGRAGGEADWGSWTWEAKSVNGRGLDVRAAIPSGFEGLERAAKTAAAKRFKRGNLQVSLRIELATAEGMHVNEGALTALCDAYAARMGTRPEGAELAVLLGARGVLDTQSSGGQVLRTLGGDAAILAILTDGLEDALDALHASRDAEGESLKTIMLGVLDQMRDVHVETIRLAETQPGLLRDRLERRLAELLSGGAVDADRLAAETALTVAKADVREETDRLDAHIEAAKTHLSDGSPIGRKLDFLAQEMNREANTLCSKSASLDLTNAGLGFKALIDQFKEQAANVE